ncbi:MAG: 30S ribosome-binding factor RbfA [Bacteroidetes bacterium]|nr:MAG: 30S ribosome-binding factor RbfA [Bacteroidota bacterium]
MESARQQKINKLLQKDLGVIFQLESRDILGTGAMITVTKVNISRDLSVAHVYLSLFAVNDKEILLKQIQRKTSAFRNLLGKKIRHQLRVVPELLFEIDDSLDYIENIDNLLKQD